MSKLLELTSGGLSSPEARAQRVLWVRRMVNLPRHEFSDYPGLNADSIYRWEKVNRGGLTRKGAQRLVERLAQLKVVCTAAWLMDGIGQEPYFNEGEVIIDVPPLMGQDEEVQIIAELKVFRQNKHALDLVVSDDAMAPEYLPGDYVGGICPAHIDEALGHVCLVQLENGTLLLRVLQNGALEDRYTLVATHLSNATEAMMHNMVVKRVAVVLWRRRKWQTK